ncbi:MAG: hypothetical protein WCL10_18740 [Novosphingobium sp.]|uniref:hypothetical protein n=1 Tax=Novosphingobium sp. TaxID=1874826 RepID=UPI00301B6021
MPSPVTVLTIVTTAMRKINALAVGETPTAAELEDGIQALNDVLETWNIENLSIYGSTPTTYATVAGQNIYTMGPGGNWDGIRPTAIHAAYCSVNGVDFPVGEWTLEEWMGQPLKTVQQQITERYVYVNDAPLGRIILWPTPLYATTFTVNYNQQLTQVTGGTDVLSLAPGYARALQYAVAVELQAEYGGPDVSAYARATKATIKRANRNTPVSGYDSLLVGGGRVVPARGY